MHTSVAVSETKPDSIRKVSNNKADPNKEFKELRSLFRAEKANNAIVSKLIDFVIWSAPVLWRLLKSDPNRRNHLFVQARPRKSTINYDVRTNDYDLQVPLW